VIRSERTARSEWRERLTRLEKSSVAVFVVPRKAPIKSEVTMVFYQGVTYSLSRLQNRDSVKLFVSIGERVRLETKHIGAFV
jgi:hypothetical protein